MRCFERCFSFFNDAMFYRCFKKLQNIVQTMHLTMFIAHPYREKVAKFMTSFPTGEWEGPSWVAEGKFWYLLMTPLFTLDSQGTAIWVTFPRTVVSKREVCWKLKITNSLWGILTFKGGGRQIVDIRSTFGVPWKVRGVTIQMSYVQTWNLSGPSGPAVL